MKATIACSVGIGRVIALIALSSSGLATAQTQIQPTTSSQYAASSLVAWPTTSGPQIRVVPASAPVNTPRQVSVRTAAMPSCFGSGYFPRELDLSTLSTGTVRIRSEFLTYSLICGVAPPPSPRYAEYSFTVSEPGVVKIVFADGPSTTAETTMTTTAPGTSQAFFEVNGMWYDTATNGSGISIHQRTSFGGPAFGTWFMFDRDGISRWYSLQVTSWSQAGKTLEGLFIESVANRCETLASCPMKSVFSLPTYNFRIRFQSSALAVAEVFGLQGEVLFRSNLRRLEQ
ncbi:MAG: hypothetical protein JNN20_01780 [Betaproteobacteria bacterium]|nr:hypothetical protein [Betaproteobacteria bacterium]